MEVTAIKQMVIAAWEEDNYGIGIIVSDDDTTMKSHLKHSFKALIEAGKIQASDWWKTSKGSKKSDLGQLPIHITPPKFLADPNHRTKVVGKVLYSYAKMAKKNSTVDNALAQRIKEYWDIFMTDKKL